MVTEEAVKSSIPFEKEAKLVIRAAMAVVLVPVEGAGLARLALEAAVHLYGTKCIEGSICPMHFQPLDLCKHDDLIENKGGSENG